MHILVNGNHGHQGTVTYVNRSWPCALGKSGITSDKKEGDHASPAGCYPLRSIWYRADKGERPICSLPVTEIRREDGWCDDPDHPDYNRKITLPFEASHETLWREDDLYDIVVVIGHNDEPPVPGKGSCIFMHVAQPDYDGTEGCVALKKEDLLELLEKVSKDSLIEILL